VLASFYLAKALVRPIRALQEGATRVGAGDLEYRLTVTTGDELQALSEAFNTMSRELQTSYAELERKVEERTAALKTVTTELEAANRHKSEFLANTSHELRTPLNAIIGFSEALSAQMFGPLNAKQLEYLEDIHSSGEHLLSLINDVLDLAKIESGFMTLELSRFDLGELLEQSSMLVRERALRQGLTIDLDVGSGLDACLADPRKLKQSVVNLLANAVKFSPSGSTISVRARLSNGVAHSKPCAEITVTDSGVGIAPRDQALVFEAFRQVDAGAARTVEGTGLGLALVQRFVELHGGHVSLQSEVGWGSTFTITIPQQPERGSHGH
jgi:signal transduction histidine kinase